MPRIKKPLDPSRFYIQKDDLLKVVLEYQAKAKQAKDNGLPLPQQPDIIGRYIWDLCENLGTRYNFARYSYVDMMKDEALEQCVKAVLKFDYEKMKNSKSMNIFNYFTTVAWRAFQFRIIEEKKENYRKHKYFQSTFHTEKIETHFITDTSNNEYSNRVIEEFESKHLPKKTETLKKKPKAKPKPKGIEVLFEESPKHVSKKQATSSPRSNPESRARAAKRKIAS